MVLLIIFMDAILNIKKTVESCVWVIQTFKKNPIKSIFMADICSY